MSQDLSADVVVVGVGAMGSATCDVLARSGVRVCGVDRHVPPHALGSSGGETRLLRKAYWEHPDYVPMVTRAIEAWRELEERAGSRLFFETGCLYGGPAECDLIAGSQRAAAAHGLDIDRLTRSELADQLPELVLPRDFEVLLDREAGVLLSTQAVEAMIASAEGAGALFRFDETVIRIESNQDGVTVVTDRVKIHAAHAVLTAGPWMAQLLGRVDLGLRVHRQVFSWVEPDRRGRSNEVASPRSLSSQPVPAWLVETQTGSNNGNYYGFPMMPSHLGCPLSAAGLKVGYHHPGAETTPDSVDRQAREADHGWRKKLESYFPVASGRTIASMVCLYTTTPDEQFIIDQHPEMARVTVACGFSGHGFKFASVMGEILGELAVGNPSPLPIDFLGLQRFGSS